MGKKLGANYPIIGRVFWYSMQFVGQEKETKKKKEEEYEEGKEEEEKDYRTCMGGPGIWRLMVRTLLMTPSADTQSGLRQSLLFCAQS